MARERGLTHIGIEDGAEEGWRKRTRSMYEGAIGEDAPGWHFGTNTPGKVHAHLTYSGPNRLYRQMCLDAAEDGYRGFVMR